MLRNLILFFFQARGKDGWRTPSPTHTKGLNLAVEGKWPTPYHTSHTWGQYVSQLDQNKRSIRESKPIYSARQYY